MLELTIALLLSAGVFYIWAINPHDCADRPEPGTSKDQEPKP